MTLARLVGVGDRRTNEQTNEHRHRHRVKTSLCGRGRNKSITNAAVGANNDGNMQQRLCCCRETAWRTVFLETRICIKPSKVTLNTSYP